MKLSEAKLENFGIATASPFFLYAEHLDAEQGTAYAPDSICWFKDRHKFLPPEKTTFVMVGEKNQLWFNSLNCHQLMRLDQLVEDVGFCRGFYGLFPNGKIPPEELHSRLKSNRPVWVAWKTLCS